jgi:hypothetical protein
VNVYDPNGSLKQFHLEHDTTNINDLHRHELKRRRSPKQTAQKDGGSRMFVFNVHTAVRKALSHLTLVGTGRPTTA